MASMGQRLTRQEIDELIQRYSERGQMTRRAFCKAHGIAHSTLGYYVRQYAGKPADAGLVEVKLQSVKARPSYALVLGNGRRIECGEAELAQLIRIAESC